MKKINITREQSLKLIMRMTDRDDPYWENVTQDFYDEDTDQLPTIYDVLEPLGFTKKEIDEASGAFALSDSMIELAKEVAKVKPPEDIERWAADLSSDIVKGKD